MSSVLSIVPIEFPIELCHHIYNFLVGYDPIIHTPAALARAGNLAGITWIINHGKWSAVDLQVALVAAAESGHLNLVIFLIQSGAAVKHLRDESLEAAAQNGHLAIVEFLVRKGASNILAFKMAAGKGHLSVVDYFIKVNMCVGFSIACNLSICNGHSAVISYLMNTIDDILEYQWILQNCLGLAATKGDVKIIACLLKSAELRQLTIGKKDLEYPIYNSILSNHLDCVVYLSERNGIDPICKRRSIEIASSRGFLDIVEYLRYFE